MERGLRPESQQYPRLLLVLEKATRRGALRGPDVQSLLGGIQEVREGSRRGREAGLRSSLALRAEW